MSWARWLTPVVRVQPRDWFTSFLWVSCVPLVHARASGVVVRPVHMFAMNEVGPAVRALVVVCSFSIGSRKDPGLRIDFGTRFNNGRLPTGGARK
jgi:hypothetical protein